MVSIKLCLISFFMLPNSLRKCSLVDQPKKKNPCMKSLWLLYTTSKREMHSSGTQKLWK
ncbi:hypothetical protein ACB092_02G129200 [Castanea dentata]